MTPVNTATDALDTWTNLSGFKALRAEATGDADAALPKVAKQFEAIFTQMLLKSMREAGKSLGSDLSGSDAADSWQDMADHQLALSLSSSGKGLGIADMLVRQLGGRNAAAPALDTGVPAADRWSANPGVRAAAGAADAVPALSGEAWRDALGRLAGGALDVAESALKALPGGDPVAFVRALAPHARAAAEKLGVSVRALLAQAALETGWGRHLPNCQDGSSSFNLFGIKAGGGWNGAKVSVPTLEYENGLAVRRRDAFRAYRSPAESFADYARLLSESPRYAGALGKGENVAGFAHALVRGGYATDPAYAQKITRIANSPEMRSALAALGGGAVGDSSFDGAGR